MGTTATIETGRLVLRGWRPADRASFAAINADPEVMEHFPSMLSAEETAAFVDRIEDHHRSHGFGLWVVERREDGQFLGFTGLSVPAFDSAFTPAVEVGWRLARSAWGRGYATEAATAAVAYGFGAIGLDEIVSFTAVGNHRSRAVMRRIGMRHDPGDDFEHPFLPDPHPLRRHVLYRLPRSSGAARVPTTSVRPAG